MVVSRGRRRRLLFWILGCYDRREALIDGAGAGTGENWCGVGAGSTAGQRGKGAEQLLFFLFSGFFFFPFSDLLSYFFFLFFDLLCLLSYLHLSVLVHFSFPVCSREAWRS
jgi:hypothetical protein